MISPVRFQKYVTPHNAHTRVRTGVKERPKRQLPMWSKPGTGPQQAGFHERACRYWEARGDDPPTTTPSSLAKIEAALGRNGVAVFRDPTCVRPASTRAALNCRPETILVVGCLMDAYSTVTYWAACLYQIRGYLAVLNGPA